MILQAVLEGQHTDGGTVIKLLCRQSSAGSTLLHEVLVGLPESTIGIQLVTGILVISTEQ